MSLVDISIYSWRNCYPILVRKNLLKFCSNKFFSIYNYLFVSFLYSVFNEHFVLPLLFSLLPLTYFHMQKWIVKSEEVISEIFIRFRLWKFLVGPSGLEPPTSCLSGTRSNLLSYEPLWLVCSSHTWTNYALCILHSALRHLVAWWRWWDSIRGAYCVPWSPTALTVHRTVIHFRLCSNPFQYCDCLSPLYWRDLNSPNGGDDGIRTHDPLLAGQVLSQLSYTPRLLILGFCFSPFFQS